MSEYLIHIPLQKFDSDVCEHGVMYSVFPADGITLMNVALRVDVTNILRAIASCTHKCLEANGHHFS